MRLFVRWLAVVQLETGVSFPSALEHVYRKASFFSGGGIAHFLFKLHTLWFVAKDELVLGFCMLRRQDTPAFWAKLPGHKCESNIK